MSPGPIRTPILEKTGLPAEAIAEFEAGLTQSVALKRFGQPEEIANVVLFLASEDSSYLVGTEVFADGGLAEL